MYEPKWKIKLRGGGLRTPLQACIFSFEGGVFIKIGTKVYSYT